MNLARENTGLTLWGVSVIDMLRAGAIYGGGDALAALFTGQFHGARLAGMTLVGTLLYAPEVRLWFNWIQQRFASPNSGVRALLAMLWFNPLWIARHALFIRLFSDRWHDINVGLMGLGLHAFLLNAPIALLVNWLIQNRTPLRWRVTASAAFSACTAIFYALAEAYFG